MEKCEKIWIFKTYLVKFFILEKWNSQWMKIDSSLHVRLLRKDRSIKVSGVNGMLIGGISYTVELRLSLIMHWNVMHLEVLNNALQLINNALYERLS